MTSAQLPNGIVTSDVLAAHLQEIIVEYESYKKQFRRAESREPVSVPVEAVELDDELHPCSKPFHMVTRDMSSGGVGMFHTEPVTSKFLSLKFSSPVSLESFGVIARVGHCSPCGHYYIIGCIFITDPAELEA
jgi:hypothetical protein